MTLHLLIEWVASIICIIGLTQVTVNLKRAVLCTGTGCGLFVIWTLQLDPPAYPVAVLDAICSGLAFNNYCILKLKERIA